MKELRSATNNTAIIISNDGTLSFTDPNASNNLLNKVYDDYGTLNPLSNVQINSNTFTWNFYPYASAGYTFYNNTFITANSTVFRYTSNIDYQAPNVVFSAVGFNSDDLPYYYIQANSSTLLSFANGHNGNGTPQQVTKTIITANGIQTQANGTNRTITKEARNFVRPGMLYISNTSANAVVINSTAITLISNDFFTAPKYLEDSGDRKNYFLGTPYVFLNDKTWVTSAKGQGYNTLFNNVRIQFGNTRPWVFLANNNTLGFIVKDQSITWFNEDNTWLPYTFNSILSYSVSLSGNTANLYNVIVESCNTSCIKFKFGRRDGNTSVNPANTATFTVDWMVIGT